MGLSLLPSASFLLNYRVYGGRAGVLVRVRVCLAMRAGKYLQSLSWTSLTSPDSLRPSITVALKFLAGPSLLFFFSFSSSFFSFLSFDRSVSSRWNSEMQNVSFSQSATERFRFAFPYRLSLRGVKFFNDQMFSLTGGLFESLEAIAVIVGTGVRATVAITIATREK